MIACCVVAYTRVDNMVESGLINEAKELYSLKSLKACQTGVRLLSDQEAQQIKQLFKITDLEKIGSRNLGNTGIMMYIADNKYYIKK